MHGGDIYRNDVEMDFSVNINPLGMPEEIKEALTEAVKKCTCYPDLYSEELREKIGVMTGADPKKIICGNGASELFVAVVRAVKPKTVLLLAPSFCGYQAAVEAVNAKIIYYDCKEKDDFALTDEILPYLTEKIDLFFLANPNNPVGNCVDEDLLLRIMEKCKEKKITLVLDECFIEFTEDEKRRTMFLKTKEYSNLIVVRAFTKIFAMPGVRLGYLTCSDEMLSKKIRSQLPEWNISVLAQEAGKAATELSDYLKETIKFTKVERNYLVDELSKIGLKTYKGEANFILFYCDNPKIKELKNQGILIRDCSDFEGLEEGYYRIAVKTRKENEKLIKTMKEVVRWKDL